MICHTCGLGITCKIVTIDSNTSETIGMTTQGIIRGFGKYAETHNMYPIAWQEINSCGSASVYSMCSYKCLRLFWHNFRLDSDEEDVDYSDDEPSNKFSRVE